MDWPTLRGHFDELVGLPDAERAVALAKLRPEVRRGVRELLAADSRPSVLDGHLAIDLEPQREVELAGSVIDGFLIEGPIGEGGTSTVYRASRSGDAVAFKVLRPELRARASITRFRHEAAALTALDHPGIVKLRASGQLADGRPYLATDLIAGDTIDAFCDGHELRQRERCELLRSVMDAVQHAHARLVLHRDLKPSNLIVDAGGRPRVLDFGVAKLLDPELDPNWTHVHGPSAYTPGYAAPEQVLGQPVSITTDVYALGVVLYRLLTGASPYGEAPMTRGELEHAVVHREIVDPVEAARRAGREPIRSDLATILRCALRREPSERYGTVMHFSEDLRRALAREPILARREPLGRRLAKAVRRRPRSAVAVGLVLAALAGTWIGHWRSLQRVRASEGLAWKAHADAARSTGVLANMLEALAAERHDDPMLERLLATAEQRLDSLADAPEAEARLRLALGRAQAARGRHARAAAHLLRVEELCRVTRGLNWRTRDEATMRLIDAYLALGDRRAESWSRKRCTDLAELGAPARERLDAARAQHRAVMDVSLDDLD